jgi:hypothetical protein
MPATSEFPLEGRSRSGQRTVAREGRTRRQPPARPASRSACHRAGGKVAEGLHRRTRCSPRADDFAFDRSARLRA